MNSIDKEIQQNKEFAEKFGIPEEEMEQVYQKLYNSMDNIEDDNVRTLRALRRTRGALRKEAQGSIRMDGFLLARLPDNSYNEWAWNHVHEYVEENGLDKAKANGLVDEEGNYLHDRGFNKGKPIDKTAVWGNAIGLFENNKGKVVARQLSINNEHLSDLIPICQEATFKVGEAEKNGNIIKDNKLLYFNGVTLSEEPHIFSNEMVAVYKGKIVEVFGDIIFDNKIDAIQYLEKTNHNNTDFAGVVAVCEEINIPDNDNYNIRLHFTTEDDPIDGFSCYITPGMLKGLNLQEGVEGILFITTTKRKDGSLMIHCAGFLPKEEEF